MMVVSSSYDSYSRFTEALLCDRTSDFLAAALDIQEGTFANLSTFMLMPHVFENLDFLSLLLTNRGTFHPPFEFVATVFRFYLTFCTLPCDETHKTFVRVFHTASNHSPSDLTRRASILALVYGTFRTATRPCHFSID
jgi:hypothetical protein